VKTRLFLFDIDGTLITSAGAGVKALDLAMEERFGIVRGTSEVEVAGRTDSGIARSIFEKHGIEATPENLSAFYDSYLHHLAIELPKHRGSLMPGILELLEKLKARGDVALGLLTGNLCRGAEIKLTHYGVWHFFEFGAFADDHFDRDELGRFARVRAREKHGVEFAPENIFVIGDTPHDIRCGKIFGARTIAIATGGFTREQLAAHGPDFVFDDFSDVENVLATLGG
jgi:phosphoglycolate phosphatase